jgi:hypothetical protein
LDFIIGINRWLLFPPLAEVVAAFNMCGITVAPATNIIASQGFTSMEDFNDLEDDDEVENLALH